MAPSATSFADLLQTAVTEPGIISRAYQQFHSYSLGNQLLAMAQCAERGIAPGPMATFPRWRELISQGVGGEETRASSYVVVGSGPPDCLNSPTALNTSTTLAG